eukprot:scaffold58725_cov31-Tisochrysis_lutea.AAC.1
MNPKKGEPRVAPFGRRWSWRLAKGEMTVRAAESGERRGWRWGRSKFLVSPNYNHSYHGWLLCACL